VVDVGDDGDVADGLGGRGCAHCGGGVLFCIGARLSADARGVRRCGAERRARQYDSNRVGWGHEGAERLAGRVREGFGAINGMFMLLKHSCVDPHLGWKSPWFFSGSKIVCADVCPSQGQ
jgi:hypothetical protein